MSNDLRAEAWKMIKARLSGTKEARLLRCLLDESATMDDSELRSRLDFAEKAVNDRQQVIVELREQIKLLESQLEQIEAGGDLVEELDKNYPINDPAPNWEQIREKARGMAGRPVVGDARPLAPEFNPIDDSWIRLQLALLVTEGFDVLEEDSLPEWEQILEDTKGRIGKLEAEIANVRRSFDQDRGEWISTKKSVTDALFGIDFNLACSWDEVVEHIGGIKAEIADAERSAAEARRAAAELRSQSSYKDGQIAQLTVEIDRLKEELGSLIPRPPVTIQDLAKEVPTEEPFRPSEAPSGGPVVEVPAVGGKPGEAQGEGSTPSLDSNGEKFRPWKASYTPNQLQMAVRMFADGAHAISVSAQTGLEKKTCQNIQLGWAKSIELCASREGGERDLYLANLTASWQRRYDATFPEKKVAAK